MVKIVALITKRRDLSRMEFLRRWQDEHPPYVRALPGIRRYVQNPAIEHHTTWPFDGMAELWFDSVADVAAAFDSPAGEAVHRHEEGFIGELSWLLCEEDPVDLAPSSEV